MNSSAIEVLIQLKPIGVVHQRQAMDPSRTWADERAYVEILPQFMPGILRIEENTHIVVVGWLHEARRDSLHVYRPDYEKGGNAQALRGVFSCRSSVRPNPISVTTARLLRIVDNLLCVDWLDLIDGTRVLDIKPHSAGFDGVFSARNVRELSPLPSRDPVRLFRSMAREAENFHGERCQGIALGVKVMVEAMRRFGIGQKDAGLVVGIGSDGCLADALQALSGATFGNRRLLVNTQDIFSLHHGTRAMRFRPRVQGLSFSEVLQQPITSLLELNIEDLPAQ